MDETLKTQVEQIVNETVRKAFEFPTKKYGDTPTDALQLVPKKYVDGRFGATMFDHYVSAGNVSTTETDLFSDTIAANKLSVSGAKIQAEYGGVFVSSGTATRQIKMYFGGTAFFDSGALTLSLSAAWTAYVSIICVSPTVVRAIVSMTTEGAALAAYTSFTEVTGLTLTNPNILKITGTAAGVGAATNDIVAKMGSVYYYPAA